MSDINKNKEIDSVPSFTLKSIGELGRWGNQLFQYCFAKGLARKHNRQLYVPRKWIGRSVFNIPEAYSDSHILGDETVCSHGFNEVPKGDDLNPTHVDLQGYWQHQEALDLYSADDVREWLQFHPGVLQKFKKPLGPYLACHQRLGDYVELADRYCIVNTMSYYDAIDKALDKRKMDVVWVSDGYMQAFTSDSWLSDFLILCFSDILIRGNSTFSWWAAVLGNTKKEVWAPVVEDKVGVQRVEFVKGNWPKMASPKIFGQNLTDLHLRGTADEVRNENEASVQK